MNLPGAPRRRLAAASLLGLFVLVLLAVGLLHQHPTAGTGQAPVRWAAAGHLERSTSAGATLRGAAPVAAEHCPLCAWSNASPAAPGISTALPAWPAIAGRSAGARPCPLARLTGARPRAPPGAIV